MKKAFLIAAILAGVSVPASAQSNDWVRVHDLTVRGIDELYNLQMDLAERTFDEVIRIAPEDPRGYFFKAMIHFWIFTLNKDENAYEKFFELTDRVIAICDKQLELNKNDVVATFYLGGAYGYRGITHQRNGSMLKAAWDGRKGFSYLKDAVTLKPDLYDAQMGFGLFSYLVGKVPASYRWLLNILGFSGDVEGGLAALKLAADNGTYTRTEAMFFLAQFLNVEDREEEARQYLLKLIGQYPENALFLVTLAQWDYRDNKVETAMEAAKRAIAINERRQLRFGDEFAHSVLANCYYVTNDFARAAVHYEQYLNKVENKEIIPNTIYTRLGISYEIIGQRQKAVESYKQAKPAEPGQWNYQYYRTAQFRIRVPLTEVDLMLIRADNAASLDDDTAAVKLYLDALKKGPDTDQLATGLYGLAESYLELGRYEQAVETALVLVALQPPRETWLIPHGYYRLGQAYAKMGKVAEARAAFEAVDRYDMYEYQSRLESRVERELEELSVVK